MKITTESNIKEVSHEGTTLTVKFRGDSEYQYFDVPASLFEEMRMVWLDGKSVGSFFAKRVKPFFRYEKVEAHPPPEA